MSNQIKIKIVPHEDELKEYTTQEEKEKVFAGWTDFMRSSKGLLEEEEGDELDFVIQKKLERLQQLNDQISQLENKVEELLAQAKAAKGKIPTCPKQPTMKDLLVYCSTLKDSVSGKLTPDKKASK